MIDQLIGHHERMFQLVTDRIRAIADVAKTAAEIRRTDVGTAKDQVKLAALEEALWQLHDLRQSLSVREVQIHRTLDNARRMAEAARPIENGYGYPLQYPKHTWDAFMSLFNTIPVETRMKIREIRVPPEAFNPGDFSRTQGVEFPWLESSTTTTFGRALSWMIENITYPMQATVMHSILIDNVFPKIREAAQIQEVELEKKLKETYDDKLKIIKEMAEQSK